MLLNKNHLLVIGEFLRGYEQKLTGSEIARKKKLNQKSVANLLNELEDQAMLRSTAQGRNRLYFLNLDNTEMTRQFLSSAEQLRALQFYGRNPLIREIAAKLLASCEGIVIVFGSYAKGREKEGSDIDVFIAGKSPSERIVEEIGKLYNVEIHVVSYSMQNLREALQKNDRFIGEILTDHLILKGADQFVQLVMKEKYGKA